MSERTRSDAQRYRVGGSKSRGNPVDYNHGSLGIHASPQEVRHAYFLWLMELVDLNGPNHLKCITPGKESETFFRLALKLYNTTFRPLIENDDNRAIDGKNLRISFASLESGFDNYEALDEPNCTMLEMLIGFAMRIDRDIMMGIDDPERHKNWFWLMLDNCGLSIYNDELVIRTDPIAEGTDAAINKVIDDINERRYDWKGVGGLFPVNDHARGDYKHVELWYQMQDYFRENMWNEL